MTSLTLAGRNALVLGVERPAGRIAAVALAEAGADVAVVTSSEETKATFAANSTANEFWALGRKGAALTSDGSDASVAAAIARATADLGAISIVVWLAPPSAGRGALAGLRSDPAILVLIGDDDAPANARQALAWTRELADAGLRANAIIASRAAADAIGPSIKEHHAAASMSVGAAIVYLASDASAAIEGAVLVAEV